MDIGGWLRSLGLEQYEVAFRENAIDDSVLSSLTAEDLKELGVDAVGHRRKLLNNFPESARAVGASLHRGGADRESRGAVGQSRTAVGATLGAC
jgi:hypothetical protein